MSNNDIYQERLASVRQRIQVVRELLADPSTASSSAIAGVSESVSREALVRELKGLERDEIALMNQLAGVSSRIFKVDLK